MLLLYPVLDLMPTKYLILSATAVLIVVTWFMRPQRRNLPPCPSPCLPLFGHLLTLMRNPRDSIKKWREKHGNIISMYLGQHYVVVLYSYDVIKEALVKQAGIFSDRPPLQYDGSTFQDLGIATTSGPRWKEERRVVLNILKQLGLGKNWLGEKMREELIFYIEDIDKTKGKPVNMRALNDLSFFNIFLSLFMGTRFKYYDEEFLTIVGKVTKMMRDSPKAGILQVFPILAKIPGDFFQIKAFHNTLDDLVKVCTEMFVENENIINAQVDGEPSNFVAHYFAQMRKKKESGTPTYTSKENLVKTIVNLLSAGVATTTTTLLWGILFFLHHPDTQTKAFEEIKKHVGTDRRPCIEDKKHLEYLNAAIMEIQRLACISPFGLPHVANEDVHFEGYDIPKNTPVFINWDSVLLEKTIWGPDADRFRPERFLDNSVDMKDVEKLIPFGLGRRACPGESYAKMELFLFVSTLIQRYEFKPEDPTNLPSLVGSYGLENKPPPFKVRMVSRN